VRAALSTDNNGDRNWYKPDINLDIILWAAPMVQHIHLHWSGNQAVLYGWASEDGIPFLYRSSETLAKVTLHAYQVSIYSKGKEIWGYITIQNGLAVGWALKQIDDEELVFGVEERREARGGRRESRARFPHGEALDLEQSNFAKFVSHSQLIMTLYQVG
jgi:hypothetical protein